MAKLVSKADRKKKAMKKRIKRTKSEVGILIAIQ